MKSAVYAIFLLVVLSSLFIRVGLDRSSVTIALVTAALISIPWYFETRDRSKGPSTLEWTFATAWLWFRRALCFSIGAIFLGVAVFIASNSFSSSEPLKNLSFPAVMAVFGLFIIYVGIFGQGNNRTAFRDDIALHRENKRRYRW